MDTIVKGKAYVLGDNVDTDQIIPAEYLTLNPAMPEEYRLFGKYALSSVPAAQAGLPKGHMPFHGPEDPIQSPYAVIIGGKNFGCGSSREHAPIALNAAGIKVIIAEFYARIFYRNSINGAYLTPLETGDRLCEQICTGDQLTIDLAQSQVKNETTGDIWKLKPLGDVLPILEAGGLFPYARRVGMLSTA
jgi:3-isopropylmalate/(R)-2-methylmalate dehydratase small subunit